MSNGMIFLGGFITGGLTVAVVLGMVMRDRYHELMAQVKHERARRIEAEDNPGHGQPPFPDYDWGEAMPWGEVPSLSDAGIVDTGKQLIDLTNVDDPFMDGS